MSTIDLAPAYVEEAVVERHVTWFSMIWQRLYSNRPAMAGASMLALMVLLALIAPLIARYNPDAFNVSIVNQNPSWAHWMGTDYLGRDIWARIFYGGRVSLPAGLGAVAISFLVGVPAGITAGYGPRLVDDVIMRVVDMMLAFPGILLAIGVVTILGPGLTSAMVAVGIAGIPGYARISRASTLEVRGQDYVLASVTQGSGMIHIMARHILPNIVAPLVILATLDLSGAILATSALSFLGLGTQLPTSDWGTMLSQGFNYMFQNWAEVTFPGIAIVWTVLGVNLLGDGLGEALNPQLSVGRKG